MANLFVHCQARIAAVESFTTASFSQNCYTRAPSWPKHENSNRELGGWQTNASNTIGDRNQTNMA
ncbi:hypothetical protein M413DRAFT_440025 [Hebeloma cylindrosporum]|uniref:Uncharacterized protein n=1 Tax=Hebeloma cylindrosporum TaxID=76867 RepID=A0A0C3CVY8_HEBCY|nr:hypothetical protein M413DRAFT_440025 [Hebeloma cylindrosporum h7]